jgi:hypothetical protein
MRYKVLHPLSIAHRGNFYVNSGSSMHGSGLFALGYCTNFAEAVSDFKEAYEFVKLHTKPDRIVLYGSKLASTVVMAAVQKHRLDCAGMVLSRPVLDPLNTAMQISPFSKYGMALGSYFGGGDGFVLPRRFFSPRCSTLISRCRKSFGRQFDVQGTS